MKKCLLFFVVILFSCSEDGTGPDLTRDFVGTWKTEIFMEAGTKTQITWSISKMANNRVKISTQKTTWQASNSSNSSVSGDTYDNTRLDDNGKLTFDYVVPGLDPPCKISGGGNLTEDKLEIWKWVNCPDNSRLEDYEFTRQ